MTWQSRHFWIIYFRPQTRSAVLWSDRKLRFGGRYAAVPVTWVWSSLCFSSSSFSVCLQSLLWLQRCPALLHGFEKHTTNLKLKAWSWHANLKTYSFFFSQRGISDWNFMLIGVCNWSQVRGQISLSPNTCSPHLAVYTLLVPSRHSANTSTYSRYRNCMLLFCDQCLVALFFKEWLLATPQTVASSTLN